MSVSFMDHYLAYHNPWPLWFFEAESPFHFHLDLYTYSPPPALILFFFSPTNTTPFLDKAPVIISLSFFLWPVEHVPSLSPTVMIRFRLQPTGWLTFIALSRAGTKVEGGQASMAKMKSALSIPLSFSLCPLKGPAVPSVWLLVGSW